MESYYQDEWVTQYCSDALTVLTGLESDSIDLLCTDPPYGIGFMGKDWDKALPDINIWKECLRVLKPGAFAFVMSIPRADCLSRMIISLEDAGFRVDFTPIYWTYASGFPKAQNIGKAVDKRLGAEREVVGMTAGMGKQNPEWNGTARGRKENSFKPEYEVTEPSSPQGKALDGSYGGFQPKPAVEVIIVCMKPLSEKTFMDQALTNGKGITWLDDCRIPYESEGDEENATPGTTPPTETLSILGNRIRTPHNLSTGRFPANLLVSDDVLNDGRILKTGNLNKPQSAGDSTVNCYGKYGDRDRYAVGDSGSFSRYFDLDKWWAKTFPFLMVPKASKSEKNKGLGDAVPRTEHGSTPRKNEAVNKSPNSHPTVKPVKLMSYLITLGSREGDTVLDPFGGSGTTALASERLGRKCITSEIEEKYCEISAKRCSQQVFNLEIP